jgi:uncharacterized glyoxalase superfamily protein PhnB
MDDTKRMAAPSPTVRLLSGVTPYVNVNGAAAAVDFYCRAFGAVEIARIVAEDGRRLMHCQLEINGGDFMISDCFPEWGHGLQASHSYTMHLQVADPDLWWRRAVEAGAEVKLPLQPMSWGDRYGVLRDPFGVHWSIAGPPGY